MQYILKHQSIGTKITFENVSPTKNYSLPADYLDVVTSNKELLELENCNDTVRTIQMLKSILNK